MSQKEQNLPSDNEKALNVEVPKLTKLKPRHFCINDPTGLGKVYESNGFYYIEIGGKYWNGGRVETF